MGTRTKTSFVVLILLFVFSLPAWSYGTGYSSFPLMKQAKLISAEMTGITSDDGGIGMQGRYTQKVTPEMTIDGGIGMSGGDRDSRIFVGADYEMFPDYEYQPRISIKAGFENAKEFKTRNNIISVSPTISKGLVVRGHEIYPYFSVPLAIRLNSDSKQYSTTINASAGATTQLPFEGYRKWMASLEATVDVKDSFTGFFAGLTFPIN